MKKLSLLLTSLLLALTVSANAGQWEDMFPDTVSMEISSDQTSYKEKKGQYQFSSSAILLYDIRGKIMDAGSDVKAVKNLLKLKLEGYCEIYYNPVSPNLDGNAEVIMIKKVKLKAMGLPVIKPGKKPKPMGTWVKFKKTLPSTNGYFIAKFVTDDPNFAEQEIEDDLWLPGIVK